MEHFITAINIIQVRHLKNIKIKLKADKRQHLLLTGKNGAGKTSVLCGIADTLKAWRSFQPGTVQRVAAYAKALDKDYAQKLEESFQLEPKQTGIKLSFVDKEGMTEKFFQGRFLMAYYPAERKTSMQMPEGIEKIETKKVYRIDESAGSLLVKYMVHLKTQELYAKNAGDTQLASRINEWFRRFEDALRELLDNKTVELSYDYKNYNFQILEKGREAIGFDQLSDGYSAIIDIVSDLMLRMEQNWIFTDNLCTYDLEGIVLIDELESHLHIELQRKILPFLTSFFPRLQIIVTTHSPYILNSVSNALVYDLEKQIEIEDMSGYSSEGIVEGYFDSEEYSDELREKLRRYEILAFRTDLNNEERAERAALRRELKELPQELAQAAWDAFADIEERRKKDGQN